MEDRGEDAQRNEAFEDLAQRGVQYAEPSEQLEGGVYQFSRNVAIKIMEIALTKGILPSPSSDWRPAEINLLVLQPAAKSLQRQTEQRLRKFYDDDGFGLRFQMEPNLNVVVNSASLPLNAAANTFLERLKTKPEQKLHLLILDEFDWGAKIGSKLNKYLQKVVAARQNQLAAGHPCWLLFLPISATPEMLLADNEYNDYSVSLLDLAKRDAEHFATPTYISIYELNYRRHNPILDRHSIPEKLEVQLKAIREEYEAAMERFHDNEEGGGNPADEVIRYLAENPDHMALVRLARTDDVKLLKAAHEKYIGNRFDFHDGESMEEDSTFEQLNGLLAVVQRCQRGDTISKHCRFYDVRSRYVREDILQLSTFKQDVGRCAGHGKDPATVFNCLFSAPGSGDEKEMSRQNLEDRCKRLHATLNSQKNKLKPHPDNDVAPAKTEQKHSVESGGASDNERINEQAGVLSILSYVPVFKTLKKSKSMVLLCAEPQIGKTSVVLSVLRLLYKLYFSPVDATTAENRPESAINIKTRELYFLGRRGLILAMAKPEVFSTYHVHMHRLNNMWRQRKASPLTQIFNDILGLITRFQQTSFTVVDAGCGTCELALLLHAKAEKEKVEEKEKKKEEEEEEEEDWNISVVGLDAPTLDDWKAALPEEKKSVYDTLLDPSRKRGVKLSYHSGDYVESSLQLPEGTADFLLFSLSFSSQNKHISEEIQMDDISKEIRMARRLLKKKSPGQAGGTLYIADMAHRFHPENTFLERMKKCGFDLLTSQRLDLFGAEVLLFTFILGRRGKDPDHLLIKPKYTVSPAEQPDTTEVGEDSNNEEEETREERP